MKPLRNVAVCALACALVSAAPTNAVQPEAAPKPGEPKWVESMQRLLKDLSDDNARLRKENDQLRADNEVLKRRRVWEDNRQPNRGDLPPEALRDLTVPQGGGQVPPNWRPFQFNGATYYVVPLRHGRQRAEGPIEVPGSKLILTQPEATK